MNKKLVLIFSTLFALNSNAAFSTPTNKITGKFKISGALFQDSNIVKSNLAKCILINTKGENIGLASFLQSKDGINISVQVSGLEPGLHGLHIHEKGACILPDFKSAGGHFNPFDKQHGLENKNGPHAGDLPNININSDGTGFITFKSSLLSLEMYNNKINSLLRAGGTSLVIHKGSDDGISQPSGDAGNKVACGKIEKI